MKKEKIFSPALLLLASMIWGFAFAAQDAAASVGAFTLGFMRSILAAVFLVIVVIIFDRLTKSERRLISRAGIDLNKYELIGGAICGTVLVIASAFQQIGINNGTNSGKAAFITALYVVLVPVYALVLKKRAPINVWIGVAISVIGFYLLCIEDDLSIASSDMLVVISAMIFPIHILAIDHFSPKCDGIRMSMVQFFTAALINLIIALIAEGGVDIAGALNCILPILYLGIASSGIAYTLQIIGQRGTNPAVATIILSLESVFGILGMALFTDKSLSIREYIGCIVVLAAVIIAQLNVKKRKKE